jgi:hypothetical protein
MESLIVPFSIPIPAEVGSVSSYYHTKSCGKAIDAEGPEKGVAWGGRYANTVEIPIRGKEAGIGET